MGRTHLTFLTKIIEDKTRKDLSAVSQCFFYEFFYWNSKPLTLKNQTAYDFLPSLRCSFISHKGALCGETGVHVKHKLILIIDVKSSIIAELKKKNRL